MDGDDALVRALSALRPRVIRLRFRAGAAVRVERPAAAAWRGALGAELLRRGDDDLLDLGFRAEGPPALWFKAWSGFAVGPGDLLEVEMGLVGPAAQRLDELLVVLDGLRLQEAELRLEAAEDVTAPPLSDDPVPAAVEVVARSPLQLRAHGRPVTQCPPMDVMVRSAGERLRQLDEAWGEASPWLPGAVGAAVRACAVALPPDGLVARSGAERSSGRTGHRHRVEGVTGTWWYLAPPLEAMPWLGVGALLGIGKGTAMGAGHYTLHGSPPEP